MWIYILSLSPSDAAMEVCYKGKQEPTRKSCCTRRTERKYHRTAGEDMHAALQSTSSYLKNLLTTNLAHYEGQCHLHLHDLVHVTFTSMILCLCGLHIHHLMSVSPLPPSPYVCDLHFNFV